MSVVTLPEFLLARIAEDEAAVAACPPAPWRVSTTHDEAAAHDEDTYASETVTAADGILVAVPHALSGPQTRAVRDHIARHDPARVLAECEAKRRIIDASRHAETEGGSAEIVMFDGWPRDGVWPVLAALALPYASHPEYRMEWRPSA